MNLSKKWLGDYVNLNITDKEFADGMTLSGSKVESYEKEGSELENIIVGQGYIAAESKQKACDWLNIVRTALIFIDENLLIPCDNRKYFVTQKTSTSETAHPF